MSRYLAAALLVSCICAVEVSATSSMGGAAGRPDSLKRLASKKSAASETTPDIPKRRFDFDWVVPSTEAIASAAPETPQNAVVLPSENESLKLVLPDRNSAFDVLLSPRQKAILQERAAAQNIRSYSYSEVMYEEEKQRLSELARGQSRRFTGSEGE